MTHIRFGLLGILALVVSVACNGSGISGYGAVGGDGAVATQTPDGAPGAVSDGPFGEPGDTGMTPRPAAAKKEACNGFDDDLDWEVDEGCDCKIGMTNACYPMPPGEILGVCKRGVQVCEGGFEFTRWGLCVGAVVPSFEICGDGIDQDCDGEDLPCPPECGDELCNGLETCETCPRDCGACPPRCGDATCNGKENCKTCPGDCGACLPRCGDKTCNGTESCKSCPMDCGLCLPECGDNACNGKETCKTCPGDCGPCPPTCGDGPCNGKETCESCGVDCGPCAPKCGDKTCNGGETCRTCPGDCGPCAPECGDQICNGKETCKTCPGDCGPCPPRCGDKTCDVTEHCSSCPGDCGACPPRCGDQSCNGGETCESCPGDCGKCLPRCGDQSCNGNETCETCPKDCGKCPPRCGDQSCNGTETCESCPGDCGKCPPRCGDRSCNGTETCKSCPWDCGACPPECGDRLCNGTESCRSCPGDCGACPVGCGDGLCGGGETCLTCPGDCASCPRACETFTFGVSSRATDIVWVVDQSGSMSLEISMVKSKLNEFSAFIGQSNIDYHVVMVAKKSVSKFSFGKYSICIPPPLGGPDCTSGPRYRQVDQHVASHDALLQIKSHIGEIESFMRPGSLRHFVIVSDDNSSLSANAFHAYITGRKGYKDYRIHGVIGTKPGGCVAATGRVYQDLIARTGGLAFHICDADWTTLFKKLGEQVAGIAQTHYGLSREPIGGTVSVRYGNASATENTDWSFDAIGREVVLKGRLPAPGTVIGVCYDYLK